MALSPTTLRDGLRAFMDPAYGGFTSYPADAPAVGVAWAAALRGYFDGLATPPGITGAQQDAAEAAFAAAFQPTFATPAIPLLNAALASYAALLVSPTGVTTPPPGSPTFVLVNTDDGNVAATTLATAIDLWARTGTYTPPAGAPTPWA